MKWARLAAFSMAVAVATSSACVMRKGGPDFKRYSREHPLPVQPATYRAADLELQLLSGSVTEVRVVYGSESWTVHLNVKFANRGSQPITVGMDSIGAYRAGISYPTAVYFSSVTLQPGAQADAVLNIPSGTTSLEKPLALHYKGVRMELKY